MLEIGSGSGYAAAVLARIAHHVFTLERLPELATRAESNLAVAGAKNVTVRCATAPRDGQTRRRSMRSSSPPAHLRCPARCLSN